MSELPNTTGGLKNLGWRGKTANKSLHLLAADIVGNITELAFLRFEKPLNNAFPWVRECFKKCAYYPVKMLQKPVEKIMDHAENFEGKEQHDKRMAQTEAQRLDSLLDTTYDYSAAMGAGFAAIIGTERALSKATGTKHMPAWTWVLDGAVHLGILVYMGSPSMKPTTEKIRGTIEGGLETFGWDKDNARQDATFATAYIVPNYVNWLSNTAVAAGMYYGEHTGKWNASGGFLKNMSDISKHLGISATKNVTH